MHAGRLHYAASLLHAKQQHSTGENGTNTSWHCKSSDVFAQRQTISGHTFIAQTTNNDAELMRALSTSDWPES